MPKAPSLMPWHMACICPEPKAFHKGLCYVLALLRRLLLSCGPHVPTRLLRATCSHLNGCVRCVSWSPALAAQCGAALHRATGSPRPSPKSQGPSPQSQGLHGTAACATPRYVRCAAGSCTGVGCWPYRQCGEVNGVCLAACLAGLAACLAARVPWVAVWLPWVAGVAACVAGLPACC